MCYEADDKFIKNAWHTDAIQMLKFGDLMVALVDFNSIVLGVLHFHLTRSEKKEERSMTSYRKNIYQTVTYPITRK